MANAVIEKLQALMDSGEYEHEIDWSAPVEEYVEPGEEWVRHHPAVEQTIVIRLRKKELVEV